MRGFPAIKTVPNKKSSLCNTSEFDCLHLIENKTMSRIPKNGKRLEVKNITHCQELDMKLVENLFCGLSLTKFLNSATQVLCTSYISSL